MQLYRAPYSTNCERVGLALAYKGIEAESIVIDYSDRSLVEVASGQGLVPVLDSGGEVVADSPVILAWLEERYPDPPLYPGEPAARAEMELFVEWFNRGGGLHRLPFPQVRAGSCARGQRALPPCPRRAPEPRRAPAACGVGRAR